eukprot:TRINITY_DN24739_c0_g1_i1.p1 TRINITY_DN24739_c0_g1~~TRINITY_DN24739_c0_g1_i1.p1  ORF type:complete len:473 (+),score=141.87 TRINITY_DN24739_c0_g1_i1:67-1485(+)
MAARTVYLALGSNLGARAALIDSALHKLNRIGRVNRTSFLYSTAPMYVTDQPSFLNAAVEFETTLPPGRLLGELKSIETELGRTASRRFGPRSVDIDIIFYDDEVIDDPGEGDSPLPLQVPHVRYSEREFVLCPLMDVLPEGFRDPSSHTVVADTFAQLSASIPQDSERPHRVVPCRAARCTAGGGGEPVDEVWPHLDGPASRTLVMGVLNVTPDSFSDGGLYCSVEAAVNRVQQMVTEGCDVVDIGGESTRPGADRVPPEEEARRVVSVIEAVRAAGCTVPISVDTSRGSVAAAAIEAGADIINDVTAGAADGGETLRVAAALGAPIILMHSRGDSKTMAELAQYTDVVAEAAAELAERVAAAERASVPRWNIMVDPGIGFAKTQEQNLSLLKHLRRFAAAPGLAGLPLLVGASRKRFIGALTGREPQDRVYGGLAAAVVAAQHKALLVRTHDVAPTKDCLAVAQSIDRAA